MTRYRVEFVTLSFDKVGTVEIDAQNSEEACRKVRCQAQVEIAITLVRPIGPEEQ